MADKKETKTAAPSADKEEKTASASAKEEPQKAAPSVDAQKDKQQEAVAVPEKFKKIVEEIEKMSVLELSELVKVLEEKFGVSGAMMAAPVMTGGAPGGDGGAGVTQEKTTADVVLKSGGQAKIQVIKVVKEITGKGLKEAKDLVDAAPQPIATGIKPEEAEEIKKKIEEAGGEVEIK